MNRLKKYASSTDSTRSNSHLINIFAIASAFRRSLQCGRHTLYPMPMTCNTPPCDRYLRCIGFLPDRYIDPIKESAKTLMAAKPKDDAYFTFMNWQRAANEMAVVSGYAFADMLLPVHADTLFLLSEPGQFHHESFSITQAIFNGWVPTDHIAAGHKHVLILQFTGPLPGILQSLSSDFQLHNKNEKHLGICLRTDLQAITEKLRHKGP